MIQNSQPRNRVGKSSQVLCFLARTTGLEPATTGSTVRYSNQLSYVPKSQQCQVLGFASGSFSTPPRDPLMCLLSTGRWSVVDTTSREHGDTKGIAVSTADSNALAAPGKPQKVNKSNGQGPVVAPGPSQKVPGARARLEFEKSDENALPTRVSGGRRGRRPGRAP